MQANLGQESRLVLNSEVFKEIRQIRHAYGVLGSGRDISYGGGVFYRFFLPDDN